MPDHFTHWRSVKRATRACLHCRLRKIRCNVEENGQPCSNCITDEIECQTVKSRRGRKPRQRGKANPKSLHPKKNDTRNAGPVDSNPGGSRAIMPLCRVSPTHTTGWLAENMEIEVLAHCHHDAALPKRLATGLDQRCLHQEQTYSSLIGQDAIHHMMITTPTSLTSSPPTSPPFTSLSIDSAGTNHDSLPNFIKPFSDTITREDIDYLHLKGALDIPPPRILNALLSAYIQYVYPYMPATDLSSIRQIIAGKDASISILLLQAIAFAGVPFVDKDKIHEAGFDSRRSCRKAFYDKSKLLYDLDVESDKLTIIQATLLVAYWNETPGDNKGAWHWMGVAISLAQMLGMHRKAEYRVYSYERKLYKRVWWSCYIRDRLLAIAMCRPMRIKDAEFDTPSLSLEDFDIIDLSIGTEEVLPDTDSQTALAEMCIRAVELCKLVAGILELHFSIFPSEDSTTARDNGARAAMLYLKSSSLNQQLVQEYDEHLQTWYSTLPPSCIYRRGAAHEGKTPSVIVNVASLHITFWAVISALHRPQIRSRDKRVSAERAQEAAIEVSRIDREMHTMCLDQYLPATAGIPFQFPAFIINTKLLEKQTTYGATEILSSLFFCIKVIETLRESFVGGDAGIKFTTMIAKKADITLSFNEDSKLCRIGYRGVHYSPGIYQLNFDLNSVGSGSGDASPHRSLSEFYLETDRSPIGKVVDQNDVELLPFDDINAVDWDSLSNNLPVFDLAFEQSFGTLTSWHPFLDVEMELRNATLNT